MLGRSIVAHLKVPNVPIVLCAALQNVQQPIVNLWDAVRLSSTIILRLDALAPLQVLKKLCFVFVRGETRSSELKPLLVYKNEVTVLGLLESSAGMYSVSKLDFSVSVESRVSTLNRVNIAGTRSAEVLRGDQL